MNTPVTISIPNNIIAVNQQHRLEHSPFGTQQSQQQKTKQYEIQQNIEINARINDII